MRFLIAACKDYPDKQKALFIMSYIKMMEELEKRRKRMEFEQVNGILKELYKHMSNFVHFKEKGLFLFSQEDATTLVNRLKEMIDVIKKDKMDR